MQCPSLFHINAGLPACGASICLLITSRPRARSSQLLCPAGEGGWLAKGAAHACRCGALRAGRQEHQQRALPAMRRGPHELCRVLQCLACLHVVLCGVSWWQSNAHPLTLAFLAQSEQGGVQWEIVCLHA